MVSIPEYSFRYKVQALRNLTIGMLKWQCQLILDMWTEISNSVDKESFQQATSYLRTLANLHLLERMLQQILHLEVSI